MKGKVFQPVSTGEGFLCDLSAPRPEPDGTGSEERGNCDCRFDASGDRCEALPSDSCAF